MESAASYCLNIPSVIPSVLEDPKGNDGRQQHCRFLFVSENEIIHRAGNTLQIKQLPIPSNSAQQPIEYLFSKLKDPRSKGPIFVESRLGRGFSSLCYNRSYGRLAYSPRSTSPSILIRSLKERKLICKIDGGAQLEYADICFNLIGTKLAAIGKGDIDATLFVWSIVRNELSEQDEKKNNHHLPYKTILIAKHVLKNPVSQCLINPMDDNYISLTHADGKYITICQLSRFVDKYKVKERSFNLSEVNNARDEKLVISTIAWEAHNCLLVGTSDGSIYLTKDTSDEMVTLLPNDRISGYGAVRSIIITSSFVIVGFQVGKLVWIERPENAEEMSNFNVKQQISIDDEIVDVSCDPTFKRVLVFTQNGDLHVCSTDVSNSEANIDTEVAAVRLANVHDGVVSSLASVVLTGKASVTLLLSGGCDGKVKVLRDSHVSNVQSCLQSTIACLDVGSPVTSLQTLRGYPVCAVGTADGCLRFVYIGKNKEHNSVHGVDGNIMVDMIVLKSEVLSHAPITSIAFSEKNKKLVAGCFESGQAFVICAEPTNLHVLGVVETFDKSPLCTTSWCSENPSHLLIGSQSGAISCFDTVSMCFSPDPLEPLWQISLSEVSFMKGMIVVKNSTNRLVHVAHKDIKGFQSFDLKENFDVALNQSQRIFHKGSSCLLSDSEFLMIGSMSGQVCIFKCNKDGSSTEIFANNLHCGPVLDITLSPDRSRIYSTSIDGVICVSSIKDPEAILPSAYEYDYLLPKNPKRKRIGIENLDMQVRDEAGRRMTWLCKAKNRLEGDDELKSANTKKIVREKIDSLRSRLQKLFDNNEKADDLHKLSIEDFVIDLAEDKRQKDIISSKVKAHLAEMRDQCNLDEKVINDLREQHLENVTCKFHSITEISDDHPTVSISNLPYRKLTEKEKRTLRIVKVLRTNEMVDMYRDTNKTSRKGKCWSNHLYNTSSKDPSYIFEVSPRNEKTSPKRDYDSDEDEDDHNVIFESGEGINLNCYQLLYPPLAIRSRCQRITQMCLLRHIGRDVATSLNNKFMTVKNQKEAVMTQILSSSERISGITKELECSSTFKKVPLDVDVNPDTYDIQETYDSTESLQSKGGMESIDSTSQRALVHMMNGTLDVEASIDSTPIRKPDWMTKMDKGEMTEDQIQELNAFERSEREREAMAQERKQKLADELKRLESEIRHITSNFNQHFFDFSKEHRRVQETLLSNELNIALLANCVFRCEDMAHKMKTLRNIKKGELQQCLQSLSDDLIIARSQYEMVKSDLAQKITIDKLLDKNFRKKIQQVSDDAIDQETVNLLYQIFRQRGEQRGEQRGGQHVTTKKKNKRCVKRSGGSKVSGTSSITRRSKIGRQSGRESFTGGSKLLGSFGNSRQSNVTDERESSSVMIDNMKLAVKEAEADEEVKERLFYAENEPFVLKDTSMKKEKINFHDPSIDDVPEGFLISDNIWSSMQQLRQEKILSEIEVEKATIAVKEAKDLLDYAESEQNKALSSIQDVNDTIQDLDNKQKMELVCPQILVKLQQGQDEVKKYFESTNYDDAIFFSSSNIEKVNEKIRGLGSEQMNILSKTNDLQNVINKVNWNNEILQLQENHQKELYVDFQLMHLSNELKMMLNGETEDPRMNESKLEDKLSRQENAYRAKLEKLVSEEKGLSKTIREREKENIQLKKQLKSLRDSVKTKEKSLEGVSSPQQNYELKMRKIMQRSKLLEVVRKQANEISSLRSELDKLRQKTFPSFPTNA